MDWMIYYLSIDKTEIKKMKTHIALLITLTAHLFLWSCQAQTAKQESINRQPVFAGQFYPGSTNELKSELAQYFSQAKAPQNPENLRALIAPHAGYVFSGQVAASAYNQISPEATYDNIFILAPSHRVQFDGASIYNTGNYETPLGEVKVNQSLANLLIEEYSFFSYQKQAHQQEHSLEVQLPFLQHHMNNNFQIVPIITGTHDPEMCKKLAEALTPYFTKDNLFIVSSDFSHYPKYQDAEKVDAKTAEAIKQNSPKSFLQTIHANTQKNISNLATSACGWPDILTLLHLTSADECCSVKTIHYMNSGDQRNRKDRVVGYWALGFFQNTKNDKKEHTMNFQLNEEEKHTLLNIARNALKKYLTEGEIPAVEETDLTETLREPTGAFVTLHKHEKLRGCVGRFKPELPLYQVVQKMAIAAATHDMRFPEVEAEEMDEISIEISVLTPMQKIESKEEFELEKDGIYIKKGSKAGTFLPQVAKKTQWDKDEFLGHCARDKARIGWDGWKKADVYKYQAIVFSEK